MRTSTDVLDFAEICLGVIAASAKITGLSVEQLLQEPPDKPLREMNISMTQAADIGGYVEERFQTSIFDEHFQLLRGTPDEGCLHNFVLAVTKVNIMKGATITINADQILAGMSAIIRKIRHLTNPIVIQPQQDLRDDLRMTDMDVLGFADGLSWFFGIPVPNNNWFMQVTVGDFYDILVPALRRAGYTVIA